MIFADAIPMKSAVEFPQQLSISFIFLEHFLIFMPYS